MHIDQRCLQCKRPRELKRVALSRNRYGLPWLLLEIDIFDIWMSFDRFVESWHNIDIFLLFVIEMWKTPTREEDLTAALRQMRPDQIRKTVLICSKHNRIKSNDMLTAIINASSLFNMNTFYWRFALNLIPSIYAICPHICYPSLRNRSLVQNFKNRVFDTI